MDSNQTAAMDNRTALLLEDCPVYGPYSDYYIDTVHFWVEGVLQTMLAVPGLIGELENAFRKYCMYVRK